MAFKPRCGTCRSCHWPHEPHAAVLVVVHPGSACGSATSNLGCADANAARYALVFELQQWRGGIFVIDGELSDELPWFPQLDRAIADCLARSAGLGHIAERVVGNDPDQVARIAEFIAARGDAVRGMRFVVTGAWYELPLGEGCVGSVIDEIRRHGLAAEVAEGAVVLDISEEEVDENRPAPGAP